MGVLPKHILEYNREMNKENRHVGSYLRKNQPDLFKRLLEETKKRKQNEPST